MSKESNDKSRGYQAIVTAAGMALWLAAGIWIAYIYDLRDQLTLIALMPLIIGLGMFAHEFQLPVGLKFTQEKFTFTLADAIVLLVACWNGVLPAVFIAGIEGFTSSRRRGCRLSSNFFSSAIMSLGAAVAAAGLGAVLRYVFSEAFSGGKHSFLAVAVALLVASIIQIATNIVLLSTLIALRHG